jgi:hypothetical protein
MTKTERHARLQKIWGKRSPKDLAEEFGVSASTIRKDAKELGLPKYVPRSVAVNVADLRRTQDLRDERRQKRDLAKTVAKMDKEIEAALAVSKHRASYKITHDTKVGESEAVAVALASDWHIEEVVHGYQVADLNSFNEQVCLTRVQRYFRHLVKLVKKERQGTTIETLVLWLGGDFISGFIHDELIEGNRLMPIDAVLECQEHLASGIKYLLKHTDLKLVIPTSSGNHGRTTAKVHLSTESGNSLEYFMYCTLARMFAGNPRVTFMLNRGYHTYLDVWDNFTIRFHHGHSMRYLGGQSGIAGPATRMIKNWNEGRHANLDCFGHFHQLYRHGTFVGNGSLIGPGAYSWRGGFSPERPQQAFFLVDRDLGLTVFCPIILTEDR